MSTGEEGGDDEEREKKYVEIGQRVLKDVDAQVKKITEYI
jgi:hypothetical protein